MKTHITALAALVVLLAGCTSMRESMGTAQPISFNQLPAAAQDTVRSEVGSQQIARITEETRDGLPAYRVEVEKPGVNPSLWVSSDGSILKQSRSLAANRERQGVNEAAGAEAPEASEAPVNPPNAYPNSGGVHSGQDY